MSEEISRDESFKALMGLVVAQADKYSATLVQELQSVNKGQEGLNEVLRQACAEQDDLVAELAIRAGAGVNATDEYGYTPAIHAATCGRFNILKLLLDHGADVKIPDISGRTALWWAVDESGHNDCVELLLERGADVNSKDSQGCTAAHNAAEWHSLECLKLLIKHGADVNAVCTSGGESGLNPTHFAAAYGFSDGLKLLIEHGANVNAKDEGGNTPMHEAACYGQLACVKLLLEHGADVNAKNLKRKTPRDVAAKYKKHEVVKFIEEWITAHPQG